MVQKIPKPFPIIIAGIGLIILFSIIVFIIEIFLVVYFSTLKEFFGSFSYIVISWIIEDIYVIFIVYFLYLTIVRTDSKVLFLSNYNKKILLYALGVGCGAFIIKEIIYNISILILPENYPAHEIERLFSEYPNFYQHLILFSLITLSSPISEEIFMRGFCYKILRMKYNIPKSIFFSSLISIVFHPVVAWIPHIIFTNIILCLAYEKTNWIISPIIIHMVINLFTIIYYFS